MSVKHIMLTACALPLIQFRFKLAHILLHIADAQAKLPHFGDICAQQQQYCAFLIQDYLVNAFKLNH